MLIAFYTSKYNLIEKIDNNIKYWAIPIILLIIGLIISYYTIMNNVSLDILYDSMYIFNIPFTLGLILLLNKIKENRITKIIGSCTLEIYGVQMIFGYKIVNRLYLFIKNAILTNIFSMIILIFISIMINMIFNIFVKKVLKEG